MKKSPPKTLHGSNSLSLFLIGHWTCILWNGVVISFHHLWFFFSTFSPSKSNFLNSLVSCAVRWASFVVLSFSDDNFCCSSRTLMWSAFVSSQNLLNLSNLSRSIADSFEFPSSSELSRFGCPFAARAAFFAAFWPIGRFGVSSKDWSFSSLSPSRLNAFLLCAFLITQLFIVCFPLRHFSVSIPNLH
jgi:hypothetical protein